MRNIKFWHRIKMPNGIYTPGEVIHGPDGGDWPTTRFGMPENLTDKTVIDVGAWDGFFSFEAEKRGAKSVFAVDVHQNTYVNSKGTEGFEYAKKALGSKVQFMYYDIEDAPSAINFDLVLCYGVLYHIKDPLRAIEHLYMLTAPGGQCIIETAVCSDRFYNSEIALLEYIPRLKGDPFNYYYPNRAWVAAAAGEAGFNVSIEFYKKGDRATYILKK